MGNLYGIIKVSVLYFREDKDDVKIQKHSKNLYGRKMESRKQMKESH